MGYTFRHNQDTDSTQRLVSGPYIYVREHLISLGISDLHFSQLTSEDSYQIATMGVQGLRVEIVSDGPPPEEEPECVVSPVCSSFT
jgi:hypothetical protein